jgi:NADPH:quinone reductase-like Zn-dependent oxidoreductase
MARSIGADRVIDYTREDFATDGQRYDVILDVAGSRGMATYLRVLAPRGILVGVGGPNNGNWIGPLTRPIAMLAVSPFVGQTMGFFLAHQRKADLAVLREMLESGKVTPVIDRTYPFDEIAAAMAYLEEGHAAGKIIITM